METQNRLTEALQTQIDLLRKLARPYVIVDVYPRHFVNVLYFRIRNVGHTPAYDIRVTVDPPIRFRDRSSSDLDIFKGAISVMGPREEISFFFDSAVDLFNEQNRILKFAVKVHYVDSEKSSYDHEFSIDINLLRGLALEMPVADKALDELQNIRKQVEDIARYTESLRTKELHDEARKAKKRVTKSTKPRKPK